MRKITLLFIFCLTVTTWSYGQCTNPVSNYGNLTIVNDGTTEQIAADNWPNDEFSVIEGLISGNTYTVTGTNTTSIYITVTETDPDITTIGTVIVFGASTVSFTATTAQILIFWNLDAACGTQASDNTVTTIQCTSPSCTCSASAAPDAAVTPIPANGAINVPIDTTDPENPVITGFAWTDNGEATSYDLNLAGVGTLTSVSNPVDVIYASWTYSTTYSWSITSTNCLGALTSSSYSFTTEADPNLSNEEFEKQNFSTYPNPASNVLNIKTSLTLSSVDIFNLQGQLVRHIKSNDLLNKSINIKGLNKGLYLMTIKVDDREQTIKFIKE